jgi:septal ring factor EnvC (AmiA/AmiB activator)
MENSLIRTILFEGDAWIMKIRKFILLWLLLPCFCFPALFGSGVRGEMMYQISEGELNQLQSNLTELKADSEKKQSLLTEQQKQLQIVNEQLQKSRRLNEETQTSLEEARKSFNEYEKEAKRKIQIKARQRNLWIAISGVLATVAISK